MRNIVKGILLILLLVVGAILYILVPVAGGLAAKTTCSSVFVTGLELDTVLSEEMGPYWYARASVNRAERSAKGSLLGIGGRTAYFSEGVGCVLDEKLQPAGWGDASQASAFELSSTTEPAMWLPVQKVVEEAFKEPFGPKLRNTRAVLVLVDGKIVAEKYAEGYADKPLIGWSMTKSIMNALAGAMVLDGLLDIDESFAFPGWAESDPRRAITVNHVLQASSGLAFDESYGPTGDPAQMLYRQKDMGQFAADKELVHAPGEHWSYSSGTSNMLSKFLAHRLQENGHNVREYLNQNVFFPLGVTDLIIESDAAGTLVGSSLGYMSGRSWAAFGQLYASDGVVDGVRVLPEGWVEYTHQPAPGSEKSEYGAHFWMNHPSEAGVGHKPNLPAGSYFMMGYQGQSVGIFPSHNAVVVRLGMTNHDPHWVPEEFMESALNAIAAVTAQQ